MYYVLLAFLFTVCVYKQNKMAEKKQYTGRAKKTEPSAYFCQNIWFSVIYISLTLQKLHSIAFHEVRNTLSKVWEMFHIHDDRSFIVKNDSQHVYYILSSLGEWYRSFLCKQCEDITPSIRKISRSATISDSQTSIVNHPVHHWVVSAISFFLRGIMYTLMHLLQVASVPNNSHSCCLSTESSHRVVGNTFIFLFIH